MWNQYVSDTLAGSANQTTFVSDGKPHRVRVYYRLFSRVNAPRVLAFSGITDSTFADGSRSTCNTRCEPFVLSDVRVGLCDAQAAEAGLAPTVTAAVMFGGQASGLITADTHVFTDEFTLDLAHGNVLCAEYTYCGTLLPCHEELQIAAFREENGDFLPSRELPVPLMVGVKRHTNKRVAFLGDSITQGIGATPNSYRHWNALVAEEFGERYAFWNLGIGYARTGDVASDGGWFARVKANDLVIVCLGVNDILQGVAKETVVENLQTIVNRLRENGATVLLQSVPPFELFGEDEREKQRFINESIASFGDGFFDNTVFLTDQNGMPIYGGHPNDDGCAVWATRLCEWLKRRNEL